MRTEDGYIIQKCLKGETEAFGLLVDKYKASIYALAYSKVRNFHDAEDITQEVFIRAFQKLQALRWWDNFLAWLYAITTNLCKDWIRANSRRPDREFAEDQSPESSVYRSMKSYREDQVIESLNDALDSLPEVYSRVLVLHYLSGMNLREMAGFLGTSVSTIARRLKEARTQLKGEILNNMNATYTVQKLQAEFTFRIIEIIKGLAFKPVPRISRLTLGLSAVTALIFTILILSPRPLANHHNGIFMGSEVCGEADVNTVEIHAELLRTPELLERTPIRNTNTLKLVKSFSIRKIAETNIMTKLKINNLRIENVKPDPAEGKIALTGELPYIGTLDKSLLEYKFKSLSPSRAIKAGRYMSNSLNGNGKSDFLTANGLSTIKAEGIKASNVKVRFMGRLGIGNINSIVWSPDGKSLAAGTSTGVYLISPTNLKMLSYMEAHSDIVSSVAFSPDGKLIASGSYDRTIKLWDVSDGRCLNTLLGHSGGINSVAFSPDGLTIASGSADRTIKLWNVSDGQCINTLNGHKNVVESLAFSPDGLLIASGSRDETLKIWNTSDGKCINTQRVGQGKVICSVAFSHDGAYVASSGRMINLWWASSGQIIRTMEGHNEEINCVSFSPDDSVVISGSLDRSVRLWNASDGKLITSFEGHNGSVNSVAFSPDGKLIASGGSDNLVKIWDASKIPVSSFVATIVENPKIYKPDMAIWSVAFSPDGSIIATGGADNTVRLWRVSDTGESMAVLDEHKNDVRAVGFSPDGSIMASQSGDNTVKLWKVANKTCMHTIGWHIGGTSAFAFSPDGSAIATGGNDNIIKIWRISDGELITTFTGNENGTRLMAFSPDGLMMATASRGKNGNQSYINLWSMPRGECMVSIKEINSRIHKIAFSPDGSTLGSIDHRDVKIWDTVTGDCISIIEGAGNMVATFSPDLSMVASSFQHNNIRLYRLPDGEFIATIIIDPYNWPSALAFSQDNSKLVSGATFGTVRLWKVPDKEWVTGFGGHAGSVQSIAISPDNSLLASGGSDRHIRLWNTQHGKTVANIWGHNGNVNSLDFSSDGSMMASAGDDGLVRLWNPSNGRIIASLSGHEGAVNSVAISQDNSLLASGGTDREIRIWGVSDRKWVAVLKGHRDITWTGVRGSVLSVAFSPDGSLLASGSDDKTIKIWKVSGGECIATLKGHDGFVNSVAFSPDGSLIASGSDDKTVKIWRVSDTKCMATLSGHKDTINSVSFNPDGTLIVSGGADRTVRIWDVSERKLISTLSNHRGAVNSTVFSHDGSAVISGSSDGTIGIWEI